MMIKEKKIKVTSYGTKKVQEEIIYLKLLTVAKELEARGYNPVNQLVGYLMSNDPAYISSHNNARNIIQTMDRDEIIEELVRNYTESNDD